MGRKKAWTPEEGKNGQKSLPRGLMELAGKMPTLGKLELPELAPGIRMPVS